MNRYKYLYLFNQISSTVTLSKKTRYAIVALTRLAREYGNGPIQIRDIAESEKIPQRFLESILLELRKLGILGSKLGKEGGYYLLKETFRGYII